MFFYKLIISGIVCITGYSVLNYVRHNYISLMFSAINILFNIKYHCNKCFKKKITNNNSIVLQNIHVCGDFINYNKKISTMIGYEFNINNLQYYTGTVHFKIQYQFNKQNYYFIRTNYINECMKEFKHFIQKLKNNTHVSSRILDSALCYDDNCEINITSLIQKIEGPLSDFNNGITFTIFYQLLKNEQNIIVNDEMNPVLTIIDNMGEDHKYNPDSIILI